LLFGCTEEDILKEIRQKEIFCDAGLSVVVKDIKTKEIAAVLLSNDMNYCDANLISVYS